MKKTLVITNIFVAILSLGLMWGCQSTVVGPSTESQKENLLVRAGFKAKTVTTPKQKSRVTSDVTRDLLFHQDGTMAGFRVVRPPTGVRIRP